MGHPTNARDAINDWRDWRDLLASDAQGLRAAAAACDPSDVAAVTALRRDYPQHSPTLISHALALATARDKARRKFAARGDTMVADPAGVEQASSWRVAQYKAQRIAQAVGTHTRVFDVCCGIGGDAMAMQDAGLQVIGVDSDPVRAWMTQQNAGCPTIAAALETMNLSGQVVHLDPDRRAARNQQRTWRIEDYVPGPQAMSALIERCPDCVIKLGPGVDRDAAQALAGPRGEIEFISEAGRMVQALCWTGRLASGVPRRATLLAADGTDHTLSASPYATNMADGLDVADRDDVHDRDIADSDDIESYDPDPYATEIPYDQSSGTAALSSEPIARYIYTVDASIERAQLIDTIARQAQCDELWPGLGILGSDQEVTNVWLRGYELRALMPWRMNKVTRYLRECDIGPVTVKTRGCTVDADKIARQWRNSKRNPKRSSKNKNGQPAVVFIVRRQRQQVAMITHPLA